MCMVLFIMLYEVQSLTFKTVDETLEGVGQFKRMPLSNLTLSRNAETIDFARLTSHPVRGWTGKNKTFCSPGTQNGRRLIKVYSLTEYNLFFDIIKYRK